jgi:hypothetical protein
MQLSEYIQGLQEFLIENGDMKIFYAIDDEGNAYQSVNYTGTKMLLLEEDKETYRPDLYGEEDAEEYEDDNFIPVCVIN